MEKWLIQFPVGLVLLSLFLATSEGYRVNQCFLSKAKSCTECIQVAKDCSYCADEGFRFVRCDFMENLKIRGCNNRIMVKSETTSLQSKAIDKSIKKKQVSLQRVSMKLVAGDESTVDFEIFEPKETPVDLYILMDFSNSMSDDLANLKKLGAGLADFMQRLSHDYTIGFGKFVDKVVAPQTDMRPEKLRQPWPDSDPPFSFQNVIPLTDNVNQFNEELKKERISGNLDAPEGGFDAILQAATCTKDIGWRRESTKLLVFSTESAFHYEGDGANVLAGILARNDEHCHLDATGKYTHDVLQDYPSVPTLVRLLGENNIIPIFAITNHSFTVYQKLQKYFPISEVGLLEEDSSNIIELLERAFKNIRSKMEIRADHVPKAMKTEILSSTAQKYESGSFNVAPGEIGKLKVRVKALEKVGDKHVCKLPKQDQSRKILVKPSTFSNGLEIDASVRCELCDCEKERSVASPTCSSNGDLVCGRCECHPGWQGRYCNCKVDHNSNNGCIGPNSTVPCSGRGECMCDVCQCISANPAEIFEGDFCQFSNLQCPRLRGFLCNDRGTCFMGKCDCNSGWKGESCECATANTTCIDSNGGICNGRGKCVCGKCECSDAVVYSSPTCEASNFLGLLGICEDIQTCVQCKAWGTGEKRGKDCEDCKFEIQMVDDLKPVEQVTEHCEYKDETDDCTYYYNVERKLDEPNSPNDKNKFDVFVRKKKDCPPAGWLWLIPLIMFLMLLLGLLMLLCWKYCACCKACLALLPCCKGGRMVGFKEDHYMLRQSLLSTDHLDTPMVRSGPLGGTDVVKWKITDNVHRPPSAYSQPPNPKEIINYVKSLRLARLFTENLSKPDTQECELLRKEVEENLNDAYSHIAGVQKIHKTKFRIQPNSGKRQEQAIVDTVMAAPRSSERDIVTVTEKLVSQGAINDLNVSPGYYTVESDRDAYGMVEFQDGVESVDVRVPLFIKEEDDDEKQLRVEALEVPVGIAEIGRKYVNITVVKEQAKRTVSFQKPAYTYNRSDKFARIPIIRDIIEDGRSLVNYRTRDHTAKEGKDYIATEGELTFLPGETRKEIPVQLLELTEVDALLDNRQTKQFVMDLSNPKYATKVGKHPRTTVTIADENVPGILMFKQGVQKFPAPKNQYSIPVLRTRGQDGPVAVHWKTEPTDLSNPSPQAGQTGILKFNHGETTKDIIVDGSKGRGKVTPDSFQVTMHSPEGGAQLGERTSTLVSIMPHDQMDTRQLKASQSPPPFGKISAPNNFTAHPVSSKVIRTSWSPPPGNATGYKLRWWYQGESEEDGRVIDLKDKTAFDMEDLYPYSDYEMQVCAYNAMGDGPYSEVVHCRTLEDVPSEPGRLAFNVISSTVTQLSWAEPAEPNGEILAYQVSYAPVNEDNKPVGPTKSVNIESPKKRMVLIENLAENQPYRYTVRARNGAGWGPDRDATINLATQPKRPMSIPIIPDVPVVGREGEDYEGYLMYSADVMRSPGGSGRPSMSEDSDHFGGRWELSSLGSRGVHTKTMMTGHNQINQQMQLGYNQVKNIHNETRIIGGSSTMTKEYVTTIMSDQGMPGYSKKGVNYSITQSMRNRSNSEDVNDALNNLDMVLQDSKLPPGVPDTPTRLVFSALGPTSLKVSWQEPQCDKDVLGYRVTHQLLNGGDVKVIDISNPNENSVIVEDLLPNHSYMFKVKAQSEEGWGPVREGVITIESQVDPQSPLSPVPGSPFTLSTPSAPGPLVFTALSPESLQLSWEKPRKPNGAILGYLVTCETLHDGGNTRTFNVEGDNAETTLTVPDLSENIPYKFKVQAKTTQGFGPEREGIITIESHDGGNFTQFGNQQITRREVYNIPGGSSTETSVTHTTINDPFFSDGMMMTTQRMETSGTITKQITKEVVSRTMMAGGTVTKQSDWQFFEA
ncbi:integrin beta-4 isoform X1 [Latimeria chalumnae]|uniref:integrin beta-4 isoform X1 n=1 Tax=Latimeria chalumnae TaxID=7897 RepID=UPI0003C10EB0|nr:PREDICTED: integrin beta-4 isoform X2 [Latimeria chalumnae]|eukprot:XP_006001743.1 PREDICTED: integrin beta-4 isoform X2 [Latimeria chalumnae]